MKISVKSKSLQKVVKDITALGKAVKPTPGTVPTIRLVATEDSKLRLQVGFEGIFASLLVPEADVQEPGQVAVPREDFTKIAGLSGEIMTLTGFPARLNYVTGRTSGSLSVVDDTTVDLEAVKAPITVMQFGRLMEMAETIALKGDYITLSFFGKSKILRVEALAKGGSNILIAEAPFEGDISDTTLSIGVGVLDSLVSLIKGKARIGFNDTVLTIRSDTGTTLVLRQRGNRPLEIDEKVGALRQANTLYSTVDLDVKATSKTLAEVMSINDDMVAVTISPRGKFAVSSNHGNTDFGFEFGQIDGQVVTAQITPSFFHRVLSSFSEEKTVKLSTYSRFFALDLVSPGDPEAGNVLRQTVLVSLKEEIKDAKVEAKPHVTSVAAPVVVVKPEGSRSQVENEEENALEDDDLDAEIVKAPTRPQTKGIQGIKALPKNQQKQTPVETKPLTKPVARQAAKAVEITSAESDPSTDDDLDDAFDDE